MTALPHAPACERNRRPILEVLEKELADSRCVLEIGSGTGEHAVHFARALPHVTWQTSDLPENHPGIRAWLAHAGLPNTRPPLDLDVGAVGRDKLSAMCFDSVFSANTAHIMSIRAVADMFSLAGRLLPAGGIFCLYGPFNFDGDYSSQSNAAFDASLRRRDPEMGIRDLAELDRFAGEAGMQRVRLYAMPANNYIAVWSKRRSAPAGTS